jgi:hypothetical protein
MYMDEGNIPVIIGSYPLLKYRSNMKRWLQRPLISFRTTDMRCILSFVKFFVNTNVKKTAYIQGVALIRINCVTFFTTQFQRHTSIISHSVWWCQPLPTIPLCVHLLGAACCLSDVEVNSIETPLTVQRFVLPTCANIFFCDDVADAFISQPLVP